MRVCGEGVATGKRRNASWTRCTLLEPAVFPRAGRGSPCPRRAGHTLQALSRWEGTSLLLLKDAAPEHPWGLRPCGVCHPEIVPHTLPPSYYTRWEGGISLSEAGWESTCGRRMPTNELQHAPPGVGGLLLVLDVVPVKEAVRRTGIDNHLVIHTGLGQRLVELLDIFL